MFHANLIGIECLGPTGSRVNLAQLVLISVYAAVPLACWPMLSRVRNVTVTVEVILAAAAVGLVLLAGGWLHLPVRAELVLAYAPAVTAVIAAGLAIERRQPDKATRRINPRRRTAAKVLIVGYAALVLLCCAPASVFIINSDGFEPSSNELLPLPAGLTVVSNKDGDCGSGGRSRIITIGNHDGLTAEQTAARVTDHLNHDHGWHLDHNGSECRRDGWLIDQTSLCVEIGTDDQQHAVVILSGHRAQD
jgi:hypothetical protein